MSGTPALTQYRIRLDDGSEVIVPSAEALTRCVAKGDILPDTQLFDAGRGMWCKAGESPLVQFIASEIAHERGSPLPGWPVEGEEESQPAAGSTLRGLLDVAEQAAAPERPAPAPVPAPVAAAPATPKPKPAPAATPSGFAVSILELQPDSVAAAKPAAEKKTPQTTPAPVAAAPAPAPYNGPDFTAEPTPVRAPAMSKRKQAIASAMAAGVVLVLGIGVFSKMKGSASETSSQPAAPASATDPYAYQDLPEAQFSADTTVPDIDSTPAPADTAPTVVAPRAPARVAIQLPVAGQLPDLGTTNIGFDPMANVPAPQRSAASGSNEATQPTRAPELRNASRIAQFIDREYPIGLKEARIGGTVGMTFYVNAQGVVERFEMKESSGKTELDQAAMRVAKQVQFTPAMRGNEAVPAWVALAIPFGDVASAGSTASSPTARAITPIGPQPLPAQFDVAPLVSNAARVRQSLEREYPIGLKSAGIGGKVEVWFYVNERGVSERFQLKASSGNSDLDQAALRVARVFQFTPAQLNGEPIATWISQSIVFEGAEPEGR